MRYFTCRLPAGKSGGLTDWLSLLTELVEWILGMRMVSYFTHIFLIYLKLRSDSKRDGKKREHVIFNQACLRSRQRRANYVYVSASAGQIRSWGGGGGEGGRGRGRFEKNVRSSGKILATPLISPSAICVSAVNICIWSFLAWFSMMRIIYKHDDLDYSQESNCPFCQRGNRAKKRGWLGGKL